MQQNKKLNSGSRQNMLCKHVKQKKPNNNDKQALRTRKWHRQEPAKNKKCKCEQFGKKKTTKYSTKRLQKIRQARNCTCNANKQNNMHENKQTIVHYTYENMQQNTEMKQSKNLQHAFCVCRPKKTNNNTGKKPNTRIKYIQQTLIGKTTKHPLKHVKYCFVASNQTWPTETARFLPQRNV